MVRYTHSRNCEILTKRELPRIQSALYDAFLQRHVPLPDRDNEGPEAILRAVFPATASGGSPALHFVSYELAEPDHTPTECQRLGTTYAVPLHLTFRLVNGHDHEEEVYACELPLLTKRGTFVIDGVERVAVPQTRRASGARFIEHGGPWEHCGHSCHIIPESGCILELEVTKKDVLMARVDGGARLPAPCLVRAMLPDFVSSDQFGDIFWEAWETEIVRVPEYRDAHRLKGRHSAYRITNEEGDVIVPFGGEFSEGIAKMIASSPLDEVGVIGQISDPLIINTINADPTESHEDALRYICTQVRPGPVSVERARELLYDSFSDPDQYWLGRGGRLEMNRRLGLDQPESLMSLGVSDLIECIRYILRLRQGHGEVDDVTEVTETRIWAIDELAAEHFRLAFQRLKDEAEVLMDLHGPSTLRPRDLIDAEPITDMVRHLFGDDRHFRICS